MLLDVKGWRWCQRARKVGGGRGRGRVPPARGRMCALRITACSHMRSRACARRPKPVRSSACAVGELAPGCSRTRARTLPMCYAMITYHHFLDYLDYSRLLKEAYIPDTLSGTLAARGPGEAARRRAGHVLRAAAHVRLPVARAVEGDALHQEPHAGVHRLPGQAGRRRLQAARRLPAGLGA